MPDAELFPEEHDNEPDDAACQRALSVLLRVGASLAAELETPSENTTVVARAKAFDGVALAVRRTVLLCRHLREHPIGSVSRETRRVATRKEVIRALEDQIDTKADPAEAGNLRLELLERIDSPEFDADLSHRSPADLIKELCRDFGLAQVPGLWSFPRRTPDDIAILCAQAAAPAGSGLPQWSAAALRPNRDPPGDPLLREH